nr:transglutaminase-like cysteine peptidase [Vibrio agarilyticus]
MCDWETTKYELAWYQSVKQTYGTSAVKRFEAWRNTLRDVHDLPSMQQLHQINDYFNQLRFIPDSKLWGQDDYWATPLEFIGSNGGDCEDFTIAKYFSLRELGISDTQLRLVYVKAIKLNQFHMVLAYYPTPSSDPFILDNLIPEVMAASKRHDLKPIYSFNGDKLWLMKTNPQVAGEASRLSLWNDLRERQSSMMLKRPKIQL